MWWPADSDTAPAHNSNYNYNCNYNGDPNFHDFDYTNSDDDLCTVAGVIVDMRESSSVAVSNQTDSAPDSLTVADGQTY